MFLASRSAIACEIGTHLEKNLISTLKKPFASSSCARRVPPRWVGVSWRVVWCVCVVWCVVVWLSVCVCRCRCVWVWVVRPSIEDVAPQVTHALVRGTHSLKKNTYTHMAKHYPVCLAPTYGPAHTALLIHTLSLEQTDTYIAYAHSHALLFHSSSHFLPHMQHAVHSCHIIIIITSHCTRMLPGCNLFLFFSFSLFLFCPFALFLFCPFFSFPFFSLFLFFSFFSLFIFSFSLFLFFSFSLFLFFSFFALFLFPFLFFFFFLFP